MPYLVEYVNTKTGAEGVVDAGLRKADAASRQQALRDTDGIVRCWYIDQRKGGDQRCRRRAGLIF